MSIFLRDYWILYIWLGLHILLFPMGCDAVSTFSSNYLQMKQRKVSQEERGPADPTSESRRSDPSNTLRGSTSSADPESKKEVDTRKSIRTFIGTDWNENWILDQLASQVPQSFNSVGHTSIVFKMKFKAPLDAAFKPASRRYPKGYLSEIAAYRLARLLGINNVPPVISRKIDRKTIRKGLIGVEPSVWRRLRRKIKWTDQNATVGAAIYWIPLMKNLNIENQRAIQKWTKWLTVGGILPFERRDIARDISNTVCFDYLIGNWDRFSGGNLKGNQQGSHLFIRDHDIAFPPSLSLYRHRMIADRMNYSKRFSRSFYRNLETLTPERFLKEIRNDPVSSEAPLLNNKQIRGLFDRRQGLLSYIKSLITVHGVQRVLVFP